MDLQDSRIALFRHMFHHGETNKNEESKNVSTAVTPITTIGETAAPIAPAPPVVAAPPAAPVAAAPVTISVSHPSALQKFEDILGIVGKIVATDAPIVLQLVPSQKVAIGFGIGEIAVELAAEAATMISALKAPSVAAQ